MKQKTLPMIFLLFVVLFTNNTHAWAVAIGDISLENEVITASGEVTIDELNEFIDEFYEDFTAIDLRNATLTGDGSELILWRENAIIYGLPEGIAVINAMEDGTPTGINADDPDTPVRLTDAINGNDPFNAPEGFLVNIAYEREFSKTSGDGINGWQTIVLPFDVTKITAVQNGQEIELTPFSQWDETTEQDSKRPFWLYHIADKDYVEADGIKANVPYLISIPNDEGAYPAFYNVSGTVTFYGDEVATTQLIEYTYNVPGTDTGFYRLMPNFDGWQRGGQVLGLNSEYDAEGGKWMANTPITNFYVYAKSINQDGTVPQFLPIFYSDEVTGIKKTLSHAAPAHGAVIYNVEGGIVIESVIAEDVSIYRVSGEPVKNVKVMEGRNTIGLPAGKYVINGTKVSVY